MYENNKKLKLLLFRLIIIAPLVLLIGIGSYLIFSNETIVYGEFVFTEEDLFPIRLLDDISVEGLNVVAKGNQLDVFSLHATTIENDDFSFVDDEGLIYFDRHLNLSAIDDTIYIIFENFLPNVRGFEERATTAREHFILKIFYNFEEIPFRVLTQSSFDTEFLFALSEGYQIQIPIQLLPEITDVGNGLGNLSIGIFATPHYHTVNPLAELYRYCSGCFREFFLSNCGIGIVSNFTIAFMETIESPAEHESDAFGTADLTFMVNPEFQTEQFEGLLTSIPPSPWTVSSGEEVKIGFALYYNLSSFSCHFWWMVLRLLDF